MILNRLGATEYSGSRLFDSISVPTAATVVHGISRPKYITVERFTREINNY